MAVFGRVAALLAHCDDFRTLAVAYASVSTRERCLSKKKRPQNRASSCYFWSRIFILVCREGQLRACFFAGSRSKWRRALESVPARCDPVTPPGRYELARRDSGRVVSARFSYCQRLKRWKLSPFPHSMRGSDSSRWPLIPVHEERKATVKTIMTAGHKI